MTTASLEQIESAIGALPQAGILRADDVRNWALGMQARVAAHGASPAAHKGESPATDILWHVRRAGGIGSSEAGAALLHERKEYFFDVALPHVVQDKLFRRLPTPQNEHMERGSFIEPVIQAAFHARYNALTDGYAMAALRSFRGLPKHPWLRGEPDDIVLIDDRRYLVDYKSPVAHGPVAEMYRAQLHHLWTIAAAHDIKLDGLLLVPLVAAGAGAMVAALKADPSYIEPLKDFGRRMATLDSPAFDLRVHSVPASARYARHLMGLNDAVWNNYVMTGKRPAYFVREKVALSDDERTQGEALAQRIARRAALVDHNTTLLTQDKEDLSALLADKAMSGKKQPFAALTVSQRGRFQTQDAYGFLVDQGADGFELGGPGTIDTEKLVKAAAAAGVDVETCRAAGKPDKTRVIAALEARDIPASQFEIHDLAIGLSRATKGDAFKLVSELRARAEQLSAEFIQAGADKQADARASAAPTDAATATPDQHPASPDLALPVAAPARNGQAPGPGLG